MNPGMICSLISRLAWVSAIRGSVSYVSGCGTGQGLSTSHVSGGRSAGSWASRSNRIVVPVRGCPTMKIGLLDLLLGDLGMGLSPLHDLQPILQRAHDIQRRDLHAEVVEARLRRRTLRTAGPTPRATSRSRRSPRRSRRCPPTRRPARSARSGSNRSAALTELPRPLRTSTDTFGGSGLSSQRNTTKPRCLPPVSSQWPWPKSLAPMAIRTTAVGIGCDALVGDRTVPAARFEAFVPDVLQRDVPVAGVGRLELEHQRLVVGQPEGAEHVQVVRCGVGVAEIGGLRR